MAFTLYTVQGSKAMVLGVRGARKSCEMLLPYLTSDVDTIELPLWLGSEARHGAVSKILLGAYWRFPTTLRWDVTDHSPVNLMSMKRTPKVSLFYCRE